MLASRGYPLVCLMPFLKIARAQGATIDLETATAKGTGTLPWDVTFRLFDEAMSQLTTASHHELARQCLLTQPLFVAVSPFMASVSAFLTLLWRGAVDVTMSTKSSYEMSPTHHELRIDSTELGRGLGYHQISGLVAQHAPIVLGAPSMEVLEWECSPQTLRVRLTPPLELSSTERMELASRASLNTILQTLQLLGPAAVSVMREGALVFPGKEQVVLEAAQLSADWGLTPTEARVAVSIAEGRSPGEIASELSIAVGTVRVHLKHIYDKRDIANQRELVTRIQEWRVA